MNSDDCSVSQQSLQCINTNIQSSVIYGVENAVATSEDMGKESSSSMLDYQHGQECSSSMEEKESFVIKASEMTPEDQFKASEMTPEDQFKASEMTAWDQFNNKQYDVLSSADHTTVSEVNIPLSSSPHSNISDYADNTNNQITNKIQIINETDMVHNDNSLSCSLQEVSNVTNSEPLAVEPTNFGMEIEQGNQQPHSSELVVVQQANFSMETEQGRQQPHSSEVDMDVGEGGHAQPCTSEILEYDHNSLAFIGPVVPSYHGFDSLRVNDMTYLSGQDAPLATSSDAQRDNMSFMDDLRYNLSVNSVPRLTATASLEFQEVPENFLRGCKWSPDGSCVLTNSNDNCLRTFYPFENTSTIEFGDNKQMATKVKMKECSPVYDFAWHPKMNSSQAEYCRIACTCSGIPIHLWDATTGQIVANYRAYDQFDEITAAFSLAFSLDGSKIYAGYNKAIRIFDTDYPVRSCKTIKTYDSQKKDGQTGIISCFTFSPDGNGLYVAGSYSRHIGMYDSACDKLVCLMQGQHGGITHLMFSPDGTKLYSGGRKDAEILCWDMRNMDKILFSALRDVKTNQRIYFDLSQSGRYLVSGNNDGTVAFWDTLSPVEVLNGDSFLKPCSQFQAHDDCVNGVSFNHYNNMIATASGQRHFSNFDYDSSDSTDDETVEAAETWDYSLRLWQIPLLQL